jgi:hypothetical protein
LPASAEGQRERDASVDDFDEGCAAGAFVVAGGTPAKAAINMSIGDTRQSFADQRSTDSR